MSQSTDLEILKYWVITELLSGENGTNYIQGPYKPRLDFFCRTMQKVLEEQKKLRDENQHLRLKLNYMILRNRKKNAMAKQPQINRLLEEIAEETEVELEDEDY